MSEIDTTQMNYKQLRLKVAELEDSIAKLKRKYEDLYYNIDTENLSEAFTKELGNMRSQITVSAEKIESTVSYEDLDSQLSKYSTITQTADAIQTVVSKGANLDEAIKIDSLENATDTEAIYKIQKTDASGNLLSETYYYFNDLTKQWEVLSGDSIYTVFNQTTEGFSLKGNVVIDGSAVVTKNLTLSGIVTWDIENSPVRSQYSVDGSSNWHDTYTPGDEFMKMTFNDGKTWGDAIKVVGTDGRDGYDGNDGVVDYSKVNTILSNTYGIETTAIGSASIASPTIYSAEIYSPNIYGENLTLVAQNKANSAIYNNLYLTPTSMYLNNAYCDCTTSATKFYIDLGTDTSNSTIKMRLGAGVDSYGAQALNIEKYENQIRIGTYVHRSDTTLTDFAGMIITPSTGAVTLTGTVQAVAVFG